MRPHRVLTIAFLIAALLGATRVGAEASFRPQAAIVHTVKRGDTLSGIAARYGSSVQAIVQANGLSGTTIYPGQSLLVPQVSQGSGAAAAAPKPSGAALKSIVHVVRAGDTLSSVAARYGTTVAAIKQANGLASNTIYVGQSLLIPVGAASPSGHRQYIPTSGGTVGGACGSAYTVQPGDTLGGIAARCGLTVSELRSYNGMDASTVLRPGQVLVVAAPTAPEEGSVGSAPEATPAAPEPATTRVPVRPPATYSGSTP
ncbi:MAG: LysM peptidoglycan-binding domain-containing protein [Caldilineales bacterium]|nr:LysM peptidoglycan-binding domain-containing protein [Caldilineales bacterium]MDW8316658.1 LysM peptidoglycan-binding domain-containing protein [Anaerolineae bacterium]